MPCDQGKSLETAIIDAARVVIETEKVADGPLHKDRLESAHSVFNQAVADLAFHRQECERCRLAHAKADPHRV